MAELMLLQENQINTFQLRLVQAQEMIGEFGSALRP